jgi:pyridoxal phosphate enzyme (YggS family)
VGVKQIASNYRAVLGQIKEVALRAGRDPSQLRLVVVTKGHTITEVKDVIDAGATCLGENYVEEALEKIHALSAHDQIEWHMIGHIQSRKAKQVCEQFAWAHSVDRLKIALRLNTYAAEVDRILPVLLECNVSGETSKFGWQAKNETDWQARLEDFDAILNLKNLKVAGLMTMAPYLENPEMARPYFQILHSFQNFLRENLPYGSWDELSMGMSADYEIAIQEGATIVRIGTAIMGSRPV